MPVRKVSDNPDCYQWGNQKVYCGKGAKEKAIKQGIAIENTGWRDSQSESKEAENFNWGNSGLKEHFSFVLFTPKRARQIPTHIIYRDNPTHLAKKTMCGIYVKGKNTDYNVGWPNLPLYPEHKSGGCKDCYEIVSNILNKEAEDFDDVELKDVQEIDRGEGRKQVNLLYLVKGSKNNVYRVTVQSATSDNPIYQCDCPAYKFQRKKYPNGCKHILKVKKAESRHEEVLEETPIEIISPEKEDELADHNKIPIEDIEIGSIFMFPNGDRYVLNEKEIDGGIVKVLFNPFHHLKGISDIQGEIKIGTKFVVSTPRKELLKKRFGLGAEVIRQRGLPKKITLNRDGWETLIQGKEVGDYFSYVLDDLWRDMDFTEYPFKRHDQFDEFGWNVYGNYMVLVWKCQPTHYSERNQEWILENRFGGYYDGIIKLLGDGKYEILYETFENYPNSKKIEIIRGDLIDKLRNVMLPEIKYHPREKLLHKRFNIDSPTRIITEDRDNLLYLYVGSEGELGYIGNVDAKGNFEYVSRLAGGRVLGYYAVKKEYPLVSNFLSANYGKVMNQEKIDAFNKNPNQWLEIKSAETFEAEDEDYDRTYGKKQGAIRRRLKKKIMGQAIVGTKKGQWSARKSQELKRQYEEACEKKGLNAYKGKKTKKQKDLSKWSKQDWTTKSGKPSSETGERYLPKKAIKALTDKEYKKTSDKKRKDSKKGKQFSDQPKKIADKVAKYRAESSKPYSVTISRSSNSEKKLMAVFEDGEGKKMKTTHFGQSGASDYTKHGEKERMERYLERHGGGTTTSTKEDWKDPTTAGALSRWILWNKPSLSASFADYKRRFGLKGTMGVSKSAETFEAAEWAGYCPQCKKWRTKQMSKKATPEIMKYKSKSLDEKHRGKLLCGMRNRGGLIQVWPMSPDYYGNFDVHMICGMPLTKVKKKAETFEAEENWMMLSSGEPYYKNRMQARFQITHDEAKVLKTLKKLLSDHWENAPDYSNVWEDELRKKSRMSRHNLKMTLTALSMRKLVKVTSIPTGKYNNGNKEIYKDLIYSMPNMYVYFNEWTDNIAQYFDEGPSGYGIIENPRKARLQKRFGFGAENYRENRIRQRFGLPKLLKIGGKWPYEGETGKIMRDWYVILEEVNNPKTDVTYYGFTGKGKIHLIYPVWDCGCGKNDCERCNKITPHYWKYCDGESDKKQFTGQLYRAKKLEVDGGGIRKITGIDKAKYYLGQRGKLCKVCDRNTEQYGRIDWGAEETTNKVLLVGGIIAGLIGLNKLFGK